MLIEKRSFFGGMDGDVGSRLLDDKSSLNIMNGRVAVTEFGRYGRVENLPGTALINQQVYPPYGTSQTIGSTIDAPRHRIIYANWNSSYDHAIYAYDLITGITYAVIYDSQVIGGLNFSKTNRIDRDMRVIGDMLYWTDDLLNEPRRLNIEAGIKMNHASYVTTVAPYSYPMNSSVIALIRRPFGLPPSASKVTDGTATTNFIKEFAGQFASVLIYRDSEESVVSVPSAMVNYSFSTDTFNAIDVSFPVAEQFDQDVQIVQLAVRFDNAPDYFIVKEWNRAVVSEAAEIAAHNSGATPLTYRFFNDKQGVPIGLHRSTKDADNIALKAKSLEIVDSRLFLGNYVKGYDVPDTTSLFGEVVMQFGSTGTDRVFRPSSSYQIAVQFRDKAKRRCAVVTHPSLVMNIPDRNYSFTSYAAEILWTLSNTSAATEIPDWAYYYDILITKNLTTRFFVETLANVQYAKKNQQGVFAYQNTYDTGVFGLAINLSFLNWIGIGYVFSEGDVCRLHLNTTSTVYELPVIAQDGLYIIVNAVDIGNLTTQPGVVFQIYTPYQRQPHEPFFTTGQSFLVSNPGTPSRTYSTLSGTIPGDVYRVVYGGILSTVRTSNMSSNFLVNWRSWFNIYGEANIQSILGQTHKDNFVQWSNVLIEGTQINGLSTFDALDEKPVQAELGAITKIQLTTKISDLGQGDVMLAICGTETASLYIGETQIMDASSQGNLAVSSSVIGSINVLKGSSGTTNKETVVQYLGLVFFYDIINGFVTQYSTNGLEFVSRYNQSRFFKNYAKDYLLSSSGNLDNINGFHHIPTGIDPFHKEVIIGLPGLIYENYADILPSYTSVPSYATSIINRFDIYDKLAKTMAFKFEENLWGSNYEYGAEWYEMIDNQLFGFKDGNLYQHNADTVNWNRFYGVQRPVRICCTGNLNPSAMKDLFNIAVEANAIPDFTVAMANYPNAQITDLADTDFTNQEGVMYASFLRDRLSPNSSGTPDQKLYTGDVLKEYAIFVMAEFQQYEELFHCDFLNIGYEVSKGQRNIINTINK